MSGIRYGVQHQHGEHKQKTVQIVRLGIDGRGRVAGANRKTLVRIESGEINEKVFSRK